jgi:VIT1/CCC1 family predicted Fe2+/Mn2+ transporter
MANDSPQPMTPGDYSQPQNKRALEPIERISEVLFGLIMVLTFTCSFSIAESGRAEVRTMFYGALGCNLAWGIIDAIMYLMGCLAERARSLATVRAVRRTDDPRKADALITQELPPVVASVLSPAQFAAIRGQLQQLPEPPRHPQLTRRDWSGAVSVLLLVVLSTLPVVLPFALLHNVLRAHRLSNAIAIVLLFVTGYGFGRCTGYSARAMGVVMVAIGGALVGLTILLGG